MRAKEAGGEASQWQVGGWNEDQLPVWTAAAQSGQKQKKEGNDDESVREMQRSVGRFAALRVVGWKIWERVELATQGDMLVFVCANKKKEDGPGRMVLLSWLWWWEQVGGGGD